MCLQNRRRQTYYADPAPPCLPTSSKVLDHIPEDPEGDRRLFGKNTHPPTLTNGFQSKRFYMLKPSATDEAPQGVPCCPA